MSLPRVEGDVIVNFDANDRASPKIKSATDRINQQYRKMRDEQRAVGRQFELNNQRFVQTARFITSVGNIAQRGIGIFQAYTLGQIRLTDALRDEREILRDLQAARASGDIEAQTKLEEDYAEAQERTKRVQQDNILNYITSGVVIAGMAASITTKAIPALVKMRSLFGTTGKAAITFRQSITGTPTTTTGTPAGRTSIGTPSNKKTGGGGKGAGGKLFGGGSIALFPIIEDILTNPDPFGRLMDWLTPGKDLKSFNLGGVTIKSDPNANNPTIDVEIKIGNATKTVTLEKGSYAVE